MRPEALGMWVKDLIPNFAIIGNCRLVKYHSLEGPGRGGGVKYIPRGTTNRGTVGFVEPPDQGLYHPPGHTWPLFMTCSVRGVYHYPNPPWVPFY